MTPEFTTILVPTDFSPPSTHAVEYARALAVRFGASVHLVNVCEDPPMAAAWTDAYAITLSQWRERLRTDAERQLAARAASLEGVPTTTEVLFGAPARAITDVAKERGVGLIVMGTHGHTGVTHLVLGSVAERVVRTAPCPVLTVREPSAPSAEKAERVAVAAAT
jgi:nucleotide-binding universal stress UspA family protein